MATIRMMLLVSACMSRSMTQGYRMFADRIPNGNQVPHPCKACVLWRGVGHFNVAGGGFRNPFGLDFNNAGRQWTEELCGKDSDGDGRTNGEELGDPHCVWKVGDIPHFTQGLSHPGICDPIDSAQCKGKTFHYGLFHNQEEWMADACKSSEFNCSGLHEKDVRNQTTRLALTRVPAKSTTYACQIFEFEDLQQDYHMVAITPIINNSYIVHHMIVFGCQDSMDTRSAYECDMQPDPKCRIMVTGWTLGLNGHCFHPNAGIRVGKNGLKKLAIQVHWNNPGLIDNYKDSSGLVLYYTPHLRQYDSSMFIVGNVHFIIPPRTDKTVVTATCDASCTRNKMGETIYVTAAINHMHYLGRKMRVEQFRNGSLVRTITNDLTYDYDSPKLYTFDNPIPVEINDELKTTCEYSSTYKPITTFYGVATTDEMCFAFLAFYPHQSLRNTPFCVNFGSLSGCEPETFTGCYDNAELRWYADFTQLEVYRNVTGNCRPFGTCTTECMDAILSACSADPCLKSDEDWNRIADWILSKTEEGRRFLARLGTCKKELHKWVNSEDIISPY